MIFTLIFVQDIHENKSRHDGNAGCSIWYDFVVHNVYNIQILDILLLVSSSQKHYRNKCNNGE
jgi:hypothetical protein